MSYVSVRLNEGLGNRFFQVAAMLGYAEKYGYTPIFVETWIECNKSHPGPYTIFDFFPNIAVFPTIPDGDWFVFTEAADDCFTYKPLPAANGMHVKLEGCFQSEKYFPSDGLMLPAVLRAACTSNKYRDAAFLHVRRGDYLLPVCAHHRVDLTSYYRRGLTCVGEGPIVVCSDDIDWCKHALPHLFEGFVGRNDWIFLEGCTDFETLAIMIQCGRGSICANSTFSWWGAYWGCAAARCLWYLPDKWGHFPLPPARDIYPVGATILPCGAVIHA